MLVLGLIVDAILVSSLLHEITGTLDFTLTVFDHSGCSVERSLNVVHLLVTRDPLLVLSLFPAVVSHSPIPDFPR
jgi:hypothetical protein